MKHNILLIAIVLAAISWFLPQHAAATLDVATNLRKPFTIETTTTASGGRIEFRHVYETTGSNKNTINLEYRNLPMAVTVGANGKQHPYPERPLINSSTTIV